MQELTVHIDPEALYKAGFIRLDDLKQLNEIGLYDVRSSKLRLCLRQISSLRNVNYQRLRNFYLCGGFRMDADDKLSLYDAVRIDLSAITDKDGKKGKRKRTALKNVRTRQP